MTDFIWVASFPKSGSTWLRYILAHLLFEPGEKKELIREMVPNMHDWRGGLAYTWQDAYPIKTHLTKHNLPKRMHSRSAIHVYRNPLDIVDSTISYMRPKTDAEREDLINQFCKNGTIEPWGQRLGFESWQRNYDSWMQAGDSFPVLNLRYEDMLADPEKSIRDISTFLSVDANDEKIAYVASETSFSRMKKEEDQEVSGGRAGVFTDEHVFHKENFAFMRSGKKNGYLENLTEDEIDRLMDQFQSAMTDAGYV